MVRSTALSAFAWTALLCCHRTLVMAQSDDDGDNSSSDNDLFSDCPGDSELIGDAICDFPNNNADCGFDGGDCCECTCVDSGDTNCGESGGGYFCIDPGAPQNCGYTESPTVAPTAEPTTPTDTSCAGYAPYVKDGYCDESNNNAGCNFDGGDCCACTCINGPNHECGDLGGGYDCKDPDVPLDCDATPSPAAALILPDCTGNMYYFQDGICDDFLNSADCSFDGGDCCACTCREYSPYYDSASPSWNDYCGVYGYDCKDSTAPTDCAEASVTDSPTPGPTVNAEYPFCTGTISSIADGDCTYSNNNADCDFDGGDCCSCTCALSTCGPYYDCIDPDADCTDDDNDDDDGFYSTLSDTSSSSSSTSTTPSSTSYSFEDCMTPTGECAPTISPATSGAQGDDVGGDVGGAEVASNAVSSDSVTAGSIAGWFFVCLAGFCCFGGVVIAVLTYLSKRCGVGASSADAST